MADDSRSSRETAVDLYRALFETNPDAILVFDDAGFYVDVNESLCRILQVPFEQGPVRGPRRIGGLGLGLAIGKAIAELRGGTLTAGAGE